MKRNQIKEKISDINRDYKNPKLLVLMFPKSATSHIKTARILDIVPQNF